MQNQPMQIDRKEFKELLKEIQKYNKLDLVSQVFQTKYTKEMSGDDDEQRRKDAARSNDLLEQILIAVSGNKASKGKASVTKIRPTREKDDEDKPRSFQDVKNLVKDDLKEFKREIKTGVAFGKRVGGGIRDAVTSPIETMKKIGSGIAGFGRSAFGQTKDILSTPSDYKNPTIAALQQPSAKQKIEAQGKTDNPNVISEPDEIIAQEAEKQSVTFKELLDVTKQSLDQLKAIRASVEGTPATRSAQPTSKTPKAAPVAAAPAAADEGGGVGGMIGDAVGGRIMGGIGGKLLGGLKTGGAMLGKGALAAGKLIGGAALAKPALIAAGVGLAAYGAYKGYKALTSGGEGAAAGADPELEKAKESKQAKQLQQLASEGKYTFSGEGRNVNVFNKETGELVQSIQAPDRISGKELIEAAGVGGGLGAKATAKEKADAAFARKDSAAFMAAGRETNPDGTASPEMKAFMQADLDSRIADDQLRKQQDKTAPVSSKGGYGDKIGSFFGGIKDSVVGAAGKVGAAVSSKVDFVKDQYNRDLSASVADKQLDDETEKRAKAAGAERFSDEYDKIRGQVRKEIVAKDPRAFEASDAMVSTTSLLEDQETSSKEGTFQKQNFEKGITRQKSIFGSTFLGSLFSKKGQRVGSFVSDQAKDERFTGDAAALGLGSDLGVDYEKRQDSSLLGGRISSGSIFKRDKYKVTDTMTDQELNVSKSEYNKMQALVKEGKAEEAKKMFDEINAREAAYVPEPGISPYENMGQPPVQAAKPSTASAQVAATTIENQAIRDENAAGAKSTQPVVMNNVSNNNQTNFVPIKGEPRPGSRGSALDRYNDRVGVY